MNKDQYEKIWTAANELVSGGMNNPTNDQVRQHLGGGSLATISPAMKEWRQQIKSQDASQLDIPSGIAKESERFVASLWKHASKLAKQRYDTSEAEYQDKIKESESEQADALAEIQKLELEIEQANKKINAQKGQITELAALIELQKEENNNLKVEIASLSATTKAQDEHLKSAATELSDSKKTIKQLQGELVSLAGNQKKT